MVYTLKPLKPLRVARTDPQLDPPARMKNPPKLPQLGVMPSGPGAPPQPAPVGSLEKKIANAFQSGGMRNAMKRRVERGRGY